MNGVPGNVSSHPLPSAAGFAADEAVGPGDGEVTREKFVADLGAWVAQAGPGEQRGEAARRMLASWDHDTETLDLSGLALTQLPAGIGELYQIAQLNFSNNRLTSLPNALNRLEYLDTLRLSNNRLDHLPEVLASLSYECTVWVDGNEISPLFVDYFLSEAAIHGGPDLVLYPGEFGPDGWQLANLHQDPSLPVALATWQGDVAAGTLASREWHGTDHQHAGAFAGWLSRIRNTPDFENAASRSRICERVGALLSAMNDDEMLRETCFHIAHEATATCDDTVALGLNLFDMAVQDRRAERGELDERALLDLGRGLFRMAQLEKIAEEKVQALAGGQHAPDPVEVHLAFQAGLRDRLQLPVSVATMRFPRLTPVSARELELAAAQVQMAEGGGMRVFLRQHQSAMTQIAQPEASVLARPHTHRLAAYLAEHYRPWQQHVARAYPAESAAHSERMFAYLERIEARKDAGAIQEGEYVATLDAAKWYANCGLAYGMALARLSHRRV